MGHIEAICISKKNGIVKKAQSNGRLIENWGLESDAHGGAWHRQVFLLAGESIDGVKKARPQLPKGAFAENIITRGLELSQLKIGDLPQVNEAVLEITQIGKECHNNGCAIKKATGDCIMPREGIFAKVLKGGVIKEGRLQSQIDQLKQNNLLI